jgi:hypothetical protein
MAPSTSIVKPLNDRQISSVSFNEEISVSSPRGSITQEPVPETEAGKVIEKESLARKRYYHNLIYTLRISSISTSQPNIFVTSLTPTKAKKDSVPVTNGYKRWSARPGTLIANTLMAAGCDHVITMGTSSYLMFRFA